MPISSRSTFEDKYLAILLKRIRVCKRYKPKFGQGQKSGISLSEFKKLYGADAFYSWFGLDNPLMYAAHKAAGGITSVYRQIGIGCEEVFQQILQDQLGLSQDQVKWSYETQSSTGQKRKLSLDARISINNITSVRQRARFARWLAQAAAHLRIEPKMARALNGAVFEVRQGYKSKDSKRQNADLANAATAYSQGYLPVVVVLSSQIDNDIVERYEHEKWLILTGNLRGSTIDSTYSFVRKVVGYDLANFFKQNSGVLKATIADVLKTLLNSA